MKAVVSEVLFATQINWAQLAAEKWRGKSPNTNIIPYCEGGEGRTYRNAILENLKAKIAAKEVKLVGLEVEKIRCHLNVDEVCK